MRLVHPQDPDRLAARNALLQSALRPEPLPFGIDAEYPIVLSTDGGVFSYCMEDGGSVVAHANLWPRQVVSASPSRSELRVGLVGNVATDERRRGQGLMSQLFDELIREATGQGLQALLLWSDLAQFYQKLGFRSCGLERRYLFEARTLKRYGDGGFSAVAPEALGDDDLRQLLLLRPVLPLTLSRSVVEMRRLLAIPATALFIKSGHNGKPVSYMVVGKGYDMAGVVHELGGELDPELLLSGLAAVAAFTEYPQVMLLLAESLTGALHAPLTKVAVSATTHPMALLRPLTPPAETAFDQLFVWGLDSI